VIEWGGIEARHRASLERREAAFAGTVADLSLWLETGGERHPGVRGTAHFGAENALRVVIDSPFGVGLDAAALGDSLFAYAPPRRAEVRMRAADPPLGFPGAARFAAQAIAATWRPPAAAWARGHAADSLRVVRYTVSGDSLEVWVGESGLPRAAKFSREGMSDLLVSYPAYADYEGTPWPARVEIEDAGGAFRLTVRIRRLSRGSGVPGLRPTFPPGTRRVEPAELLQWFELETTER
jgi:hypothetical protein